MTYIDGMVAAVPADGEAAYLAHATHVAALFREFGATRCVDCWGDDVPAGKVTDFARAVQANAGEAVVFAWVEWPDKATRDAGMARLMAEPRMAGVTMPFDGRRMIFGGFRPIVEGGAGRGGYVDGYLVPVPAARAEDYRALAERMVPVFQDAGVVRLVESWGDDVPAGENTDFARAVAATEGETVVFSWCEWPDRAARNAGGARMMADPRMKHEAPDMPFDGRRLVLGGFRVVLDA